MNPGRILLFITADGCRASAWQAGKLSAATHFPCDDEGPATLKTYARRWQNPAIILADLIEEDFRHETLPPMRRKDAASLVQRKLEQYYRSTPFRHAETLRRHTDGHASTEVLFSAITNPAHITPWLNTLMEQGIPLSGIYSVPAISTPLIKGLPENNLLLLTWEQCAGLRQSYFDCGRLRLSRLTPVGNQASFGATVETEVPRIQQYLNNMSLLPPDSPLSVYIICHADDRRRLEGQLHESTYLHYHYLDIQELGRRAGSETIHLTSDATPLYMHLCAGRQTHGHYASAEHTRFLRLSHMRRWLSGISAATAAACLLWSAANLAPATRLNRDTHALSEQAILVEQQARQITRSFPHSLAPASHMKNAVLLARKLEQLSPPPPQAILGGLSGVLDTFTDIRINKLSWQADGILPGEKRTAQVQHIELEGDLQGFSGNHRALQDYLERFRQSLLRQGYEVTAMTLPFDASPQGNISSGTAPRGDLPFAVKLNWREGA